jgi:hypothetical protein
MQEAIRFRARILRKQADLPRYIVIDPAHVPGRTASFPAKVMLNDAGPFDRNIHPWGKGSPVFFVNLTEPQCRKAGLDTGDECMVSIMPRDRRS